MPIAKLAAFLDMVSAKSDVSLELLEMSVFRPFYSIDLGEIKLPEFEGGPTFHCLKNK